MTQKVLLHVGHGKTGSSFIQSSLAISKFHLLEHGICYPIEEATRLRAAMGHVTSGNLEPKKGSFLKATEALDIDTCGSFLFSSEALFRILFSITLDEIRAVLPKAEIHALLFVRNPLSNAASSYQEFVKQGKTRLSFADFLAAFDKPVKVMEFIENCHAENINLTIHNFSDCRNELLGKVEEWLNLPTDALEKPESTSVNRSLTSSELFLQKELNKTLGDMPSGFLSRALCNELPNIQPEKPKESLEALHIFSGRMSDCAGRVNDALGYELYQTEAIEPYVADEKNPKLVFSPAQVEVIVKAFAKRMKK